MMGLENQSITSSAGSFKMGVVRHPHLPWVSTMLGLDLELVTVLGPHVFPFIPSAGTNYRNIL